MADPCVGVLGGGQLALMLAQAASNLAVRVRTFDESADSPSSRAAEHVVGRFDDPAAIARFAASCDIVTCEFENVPASTLEAAAQHAPVRPHARAFAIAQDRALERELFASLGIATPRWMRVDSGTGIGEAIERIGLPLLFKTRRMGYDGKGQRLARTLEEAHRVAGELLESARGHGLIADEVVRLRSEVSVVAARSTNGETVVYPLCENEHRHGILWSTLAPAPIVSIEPELAALAHRAASLVLERLDYVGVMALEFFVAESAGSRPCLLVNEMAPRVHNSGHWTIEGAQTSQFENHIRAVLGLPLGAADMCVQGANATMRNLVGRMPSRESLLTIPSAHAHMYGKTPRPGRKVGHITLVDSNAQELERRAAALDAAIEWDVASD